MLFSYKVKSSTAGLKFRSFQGIQKKRKVILYKLGVNMFPKDDATYHLFVMYMDTTPYPATTIASVMIHDTSI